MEAFADEMAGFVVEFACGGGDVGREGVRVEIGGWDCGRGRVNVAVDIDADGVAPR